jgi:outer membrane protein OmpA-like peptidoglycan-associated protein
MLISGSGRQPRGARDTVQAGRTEGSGTSGLRRRIIRSAPASLALLLSGCSSFPASINPVTWWHDLQGGKIAEDRPPPPGADQPYPNLASVPPKPPEPDRAALAKIANALIADRTNTQRLNAAAPLADPSSPSASPTLFGKGTLPPPPPPGTATASASMPAAEAPAAAPPPPGRTQAATGPAPAPATAPVGAVQSTALPPPDASAQPAADAPSTPPSTGVPLAPPGASAQRPAGTAPPPPMPSAPPPPPNLPGVAPVPRPAAATAPTPAPAGAAPAITNASADPANTVNVTFADGAATLPRPAADTLKQLAERRGAGTIVVTGFGDAAANDPDAQSAALTLGLSRAQAMAAALVAAGVPGSAVQVGAEATGRGGTARLVQ